MGLLDDAIREHLELKRRRGADPGEVAREQREALDAVVAGEPVPSDGAVGAQPGSDFSSVGQETAELDMQAVLDEDPDQPRASAPVGAVPGGTEGEVSSPTLVEEESLEWEMPAGPASQSVVEDGYQHSVGRGDHGTPAGHWDANELPQIAAEGSELDREIPGQERLSFE
jgi:hypothetical protein